MSVKLMAAAVASGEVVTAGASGALNVTRFCAQNGVTPKTFHKWVKRARAEGPAGLVERSRAPRSVPHRSPVVVEEAIVRLRKQLADDGDANGPETIRWHLEGLVATGDLELERAVPSISTIRRILIDRGLMVAQPQKRPRSSWKRFEAAAPNERWQIDATEWVLADGTTVMIFNIIDDHSRLAVAAQAVVRATSPAAWSVFSAGAARWGLPAGVLSDNGLCFSGRLRGFEVFFERQLRRVGVRPATGRPYHPQTTGKVERFQQTEKKWLTKRERARDLDELNGQLVDFVDHYNHRRPHQGIGRATPITRFAATAPATAADSPLPHPPDRVRTHTGIVRRGVITAGDYDIHLGVEHNRCGESLPTGSGSLLAEPPARTGPMTGEYVVGRGVKVQSPSSKWSAGKRLLAAATVVAAGVAFSAVAGSAGSLEANVDDQPVLADTQRGFVPARAGEAAPELPFPGLSEKQAHEARAALAEYDRATAEAMSRADAGFEALRSESAQPIQVEGPVVPIRERGESPKMPAEIELLPVDESGNAGSPARSSCAGNCYQTDKLSLNDPGDDVYAAEYKVWLAGVPQSNETNKCDGSGSSGCFWFYAMNMDVDSEPYSNSAFHIGPQRGSSLAGNAGANWRMNIDGYIDGVHIGGQSTTNLPASTWIRVRTWRLSTGYDAGAPYTPWAKWGIWALWGGVDRYLGSLTIDGHYIKDSALFVEVYEQNGQCSTDLERGYFDDANYWRPGVSGAAYSEAITDYQSNCSNTSWHDYWSGQFIRDERETPRVVAAGVDVW